MANSIRIDDLVVEIAQSVKTMNQEFEKELADISKDVAKKTVKKLKQDSPKRTGDYAKSWTSKKTNQTGQIVYAKDPEYRLTHLLENGHALRNGGRKVGDVKAKKHIQKAEEEAVNEYIDEVARRLGR
ncbi:HK97 gp10 family phage protein [Listeria monocytogenes]|nr:HK97 gp10 family phage protein [Listeria monocytogenes]EAC5363128.1 HK97 gp10 family phage protein [Listeria monocytogenes]EAC5418002.1 HK97 gp10 family phage protein [Listeria monocytogenes]EAC5433811.1 HK97 gp10 family phage protein [Listeria monocytogenes]EAC5475623.1 HK97 gp10 family phage protein [Listeria monocytogenes]